MQLIKRKIHFPCSYFFYQSKLASLSKLVSGRIESFMLVPIYPTLYCLIRDSWFLPVTSI